MHSNWTQQRPAGQAANTLGWQSRHLVAGAEAAAETADSTEAQSRQTHCKMQQDAGQIGSAPVNAMAVKASGQSDRQHCSVPMEVWERSTASRDGLLTPNARADAALWICTCGCPAEPPPPPSRSSTSAVLALPEAVGPTPLSKSSRPPPAAQPNHLS